MKIKSNDMPPVDVYDVNSWRELPGDALGANVLDKMLPSHLGGDS